MIPYQPHPAFTNLFHAFTGANDSIGTALTERMKQQGAADPLLVSTASDIALWPGRGAAPRIESFRKSTRGFIELTAISHLPLALAYIARMRQLQPDDTTLPQRLQALAQHAQAVRVANTPAMWRDYVALQAFNGLEEKITEMVEYTLSASLDYIRRAQAEPSLLDFDVLRAQYLDAPDSVLPVSMNDVMFATFTLAYIDIAYRIGNWLRDQAIDWPRAMVLVSGQSGRPTAGVTWASNNICHLIWRSAGEALPADRLFVAPHAPGFSVTALPDEAGLAKLEQTYRHLWCHTRASVDVARLAFAGHTPFDFSPARAHDMPPIASIDDREAYVARLRRIMEDPQQLLSNCVADYVVDELRRNGNRPDAVPIPGFSNRSFRA